MKIAIASNDGQTIAGHFGRTRGFVFYEVENGKIVHKEYRTNDFTGHARGMSGQSHDMDRHGPILFALSGCQAVISQGMGRRIYDDLQSAGIEAFIVRETDTDKAVELYIKQELQDNPDEGCEH
ncbi:MAG TPA: iron-molybdenum cofactor biosynthesis protein [Caldithrix abyssi]|uniref:Iron-molybdenum cofactor biosynthesis protein n=1 Tax=Caldithrix abyssi TaxID=187145 RepID=A0A7V4TYN6_CALAY|nr:iron-molybdenum cofactor biosynthesis protein [Caldithrix abyssi]